MLKPYNQKVDSRKTKTPTDSNEHNERGDKVASGIIKTILLTKIRRIDRSLMNMINNRLYRELTNSKINYKSTYDLFVWCLYFLDVMQNPQIDNILNHVAKCIQDRLDQGQTHPNLKYRDSKINQFKRYLASLQILKGGFQRQSVKCAISAIFGTKKKLANKRIKEIENFDWSIYSRTNNQIVYVKIYKDDQNELREVDDVLQNQIMQGPIHRQNIGQIQQSIEQFIDLEMNEQNQEEQQKLGQQFNNEDQFQIFINGPLQQSMFFQRQQRNSEDISKYFN